MPFAVRRLVALRAANGLLRTSNASTSGSARPASHAHQSIPARSLSQSAALCSESSHESHYDPPGGWLWGVPPGQKAPKEGWETVWYWGFFGSFVLTAIAYAFKPDTSIETWALEEAKRRLQAEGTLPEEDE